MRLPRFRIRTLMIAVAVVAIAAGALKWAMRPYPSFFGRDTAPDGEMMTVIGYTDGSKRKVRDSDGKTPIVHQIDVGRWLVIITWSDGSRSFYLHRDFGGKHGVGTSRIGLPHPFALSNVD